MNEETLRQFVANCRRRTGRRIGFPCEWTPHKVELPGMPGFMFSDAGAWALFADRLEDGHPYSEMILDVPAGATGIWMEVMLHGATRPLYIKVQLGASNQAIGRSFHYSKY